MDFVFHAETKCFILSSEIPLGPLITCAWTWISASPSLLVSSFKGDYLFRPFMSPEVETKALTSLMFPLALPQ